jgi:hypothetical protein
MIQEIFEAIKDKEVFLNCNLYNGSTIVALTQSGYWVKIEPRGHEFGLYLKKDGDYEFDHCGSADEIISYINDGEEVENDND